MAFSRALSVISIISVSWFAAVGCGDDDSNSQQPGGAGEGGEAGQGAGGTANAGTSNGGSSGSGGTAGQGIAGDAGNGTGGTAGDAGNGSGGTAGQGSGGEPVTPVGGAAGEGGVGGAGGVGGEGGEGAGAITLKSCSNECEVDDDCIQGSVIDQLICDEGSKRCVPSEDTSCSVANDCFPVVNSWASCTSTAECDDPSKACIAWQGKGYCAYLDIEGCFAELGEVSQTLGEFGKVDSPVEVCVVPGGCRSGQCEPGCEITGCEDSGYGETCGTTSHLCECATGTDCEASGICGADKLCAECNTSADCPAGLTGKDTCVDGRCGCSSAAICPDLTEAGVPVCE